MPNRRIWIVLAVAWIAVISSLNALRVSPEALDADILLNSIMSLQNLTPFYWGQNRLLNVLPLIVSPIRDPSVNLAAVLVLTSASFFALIYAFSRTSIALIHRRHELMSTAVFIISSSTIVLAFTPNGLASLTIGHIEYSLPALLLTVNFFILLSTLRHRSLWLRLGITIPLAFVAIGLNPTTLIPALYVSVIIVAYKRRLDITPIAISASYLMAYVLWREAVRRLSPTPYEDFLLSQIPRGVEQVTTSLLQQLNLISFFLLLLFFLLIALSQSLRRKPPSSVHWNRVVLISAASGFFALLWIVVFSGNEWIMINEFAWRYFSYALFALILIGIVVITTLLIAIGCRMALAIAGTAAAAIVIWGYQPFVGFQDYAVFKKVNGLTDPGGVLYAGDYWVVWPSVLRDMKDDYPAFGFAFRGEANGQAAAEFVAQTIERDGTASVYCLQSTITECASQVASIAGPLSLTDTTLIGNDTIRLDFQLSTSGE